MIKIIPAQDHLDDFLLLVREYTASIQQQGENVKAILAFQHIDNELKAIKEKYTRPGNRMYIADCNGTAAGCAALSKTDDTYCELKRLYVRPQFRGQRIGHLLISQIIADARQIGYAYMRLDTFPFMKSAVSLYKKQGFSYIEKYNDNPCNDILYMQLVL